MAYSNDDQKEYRQSIIKLISPTWHHMSKVTPICLMNGKPPRQTCVYLSSSLRGQDRSILYYNLGRACQDTPLWGGRSAASWSTLGFADSCLTLHESKTLGNTPNNRLFKSGMLNCPVSINHGFVLYAERHSESIPSKNCNSRLLHLH